MFLLAVCRLIFCLHDLSITERVLNSSALIVDFVYYSISFCLAYIDDLLLGAFMIIMSFRKIDFFIIM